MRVLANHDRGRRALGFLCLSPALAFWLELNLEYLAPGPNFEPLVFSVTAVVAGGVALLVGEPSDT